MVRSSRNDSDDGKSKPSLGVSYQRTSASCSNYNLTRLRRQQAEQEIGKRVACAKRYHGSKILVWPPPVRTPPSVPRDSAILEALKQDVSSRAEHPRIPEEQVGRIIALSGDLCNFHHLSALRAAFREAQHEYSDVVRHCDQLHVFNAPLTSRTQISPWRQAGRTDQYHKMLSRRQLLQQRLHPLHPLARRALAVASHVIPAHIVSLDTQWEQGLQEPMQFVKVFQQAARDATEMIRTKWYDGLVRGVCRRGVLEGLNLAERTRLLNSFCSLVAVQISQLMRRSVAHVLEVLARTSLLPKFQLRVELMPSGRLALEPSETELTAALHSLIHSICGVAQNWPRFGEESVFINIRLDEAFISDAHAQLSQVLDVQLSGLRSHLAHLEDRFGALYGEQTAREQAEFVSEKHDFEVLSKRVHHFRGFLFLVLSEPPEANFPIASLSKSELLTELQRRAKALVQGVVCVMEEQHQQESRSICEAFRDITCRAEATPDSTEQLMATGEFMSNAEETLLGELETRIRRSVHHMSFLMRLRYLAPQHTYLNTETMQWLSRIQPTFAKSALLYEEQRLHFERLLQQRTDQLNRDLEETMPRLAIINSMCKLENLRDYLEDARNLKRKIDEFEEEAAWINKEEHLFKFPLSTYPELDELKNCLLPVAKLLRLCNAWQRTHAKWMDGAFDELDAATIDSTTNDVLNETQETQSQFRAMIKQQITDNNPRRLRGVLDDPDPSNLPAPLQLCHHMLQHLKAFKLQIPLVRVLCNPSLEKRHWTEMSSLLGDDVDIEPDAGSSLRKMIALELSVDMLMKFEVISFGASKELALFEALTTMMAAWDNISFSIENDPERECMVLTKLDELQAMLADQLLRTQAMRGSAFAKPHAVNLRQWHAKLRRAAATVQLWGSVQQLWRHLAPIFSCADIQHLMPSEDKLFKEVDVTFREAMMAVQSDSSVMQHAARDGVLEAFERCVTNLEIVNQGVGRYLEMKRRDFPRFFFLSNEEILAMLSESKYPERIVCSLRTCLEGACGAELDPERRVTKLQGVTGEVLELEEPGVAWVEEGGRVELWLDQLVIAMQTAMRSHFERSLASYEESSRAEWARQWSMQLVLAAAKTKWTSAVETSFKYSAKYPLAKLIMTIHDHVTRSCEQLDRELTPRERSALQALTTADCHSLDVTRRMASEGVKQASEFAWLSQFRMYASGNAGLQGRLMYASLDYGWEFLAPQPSLVITPLTLRCFRAIVAAHQMGVGCCLQGPASSGKSDTVMTLAGALGKQRVLLTCSPAMDHATIARVVQGVAGCGAWCLLDEIHNLSAGSLSVAAQHVLELTRACESNSPTLRLQGCEPVRLSQPRCLLCITATPQHSHIPNNLRSLFRPLSVGPTDLELSGVCQVRLLCCGFQQAHLLAKKLSTILQFAESLLSKQPHYHFGMWSALRAVQVAGEMLSSQGKGDSTVEERVVAQALERVLVPGLLPSDQVLFKRLLTDVFTTSSVHSDNTNQAFLHGVEQVCNKRVLQSTTYFVSKVVELHEMLQTSTGIILVGEPFSGKTKTIQVLADVLRLLASKQGTVVYETVNPRALTLRQIFGHFDSHTAEWTDGVVPRILRELSCSSAEYGWLVLDGPVDGGWSETLHSALDGSRKLSLPSGEVISLSLGTKIIFEVSDLSQASPGTVSRCGCIHFSAEELGWRALLKSWLRQEGDTLWAQAEGTLVLDLMEWMMPPCVEFIKSCTRLVNTGTNNIVRTTAGVFAMLLREACNDPEAPKHVRIWVQAALMLAGAWAFGGTLDRESRETFDDMFKTLWRGASTEHPLPTCLEGKVDVPVPSEGQLVDHSFMFKFKGAWKHWPDALRTLKMEEKPSLLQLTVPTMDTARYLWLLEMHVFSGIPLLLVGPHDTGKSTLAQHFLLERMDQQHQPALVRLTHHVTASLLQDEVMSHLSKRPDGGFGPTPGKKSCVVFIDDLGMPAHEKSGTQPALELLRQMLDHGAWFDQTSGAPVSMQDILLLAALSPQNNAVSPRVLRHFNIFSITKLPDDSVARIFSTILHFALKNNGFASDVASVITGMIQSTIDVLAAASRQLQATPPRPHYALGLRDFQRIVLGCAQIRKENADNKRVMVRLWTHEVLRVVSDRLSFIEEKRQVFSFIEHCIKENFKEQPNAVFDNLPKKNGQVTDETSNALVFGNFLDNVERKYVEITNNMELHTHSQQCLHDYNDKYDNKLDIVLFPEAVQQVSRLCRVLCMPRGSALLLGKLGRGRQSLARLSAHVCGYQLIQPSLAATSSHAEWRECLKRALRQAGAENQETVFLVTETQLHDEIFLQDVHCVLSSGEIPNLFSIEERQDIMETVMLDAQGGKRTIDLSALYVLAFFAARCQDKLHWVLCLDPCDTRFRSWLQRYPALLSHCTPIWFPEWPSSALEQISEQHTVNLPVEPELKSLVVTACQRFHASARLLSDQFKVAQARAIEVSTRSYVELLQLISSLLAARQARTQRDRQRYIVGLEKLQLAATQVKRIQEELSSLQPKLADAALETTGMLEVIETETQKVCEASLLVRRDEAVANAQAAAAQELKSECETELAQAIPILEDAVAALNTLKPADITLVKSMKNPPEPIKLVMAAVCVIRNIKPDRLNDAATGRKILDYWGPSKKLLGDISFLQQLKEFDKDNIPPPTIAKLRKDFIPHPDFKPEIVANASSAAEGLCKWVRAMDMYEAVAKEVAPKKVKLEAAQQEYAATLAVLEEKRAQVRRLEQQLAELQSQFNAANSHKLQLESEFRACAHKLERAEKLIGGLGGEKDRWAATAESLQRDLNTLVGDVILSSAAITYLGPFTSVYRKKCLQEWVALVRDLDIPCSQNFDFCRVMGNELLIESWNLAGLPRDEISTQNAIIAQHSMRICLAIDPQRQANMWIRTMEKEHGLRTLRFPDTLLTSHVTKCIEDGVPALVEDLQDRELNSLIAALVNSNISLVTTPAAVSDSEAGSEDDQSEFRLYITTPQSQPCLAAEVYCTSAVIDFTLPSEGLEDQLLGIIMAAERPALRLSRQQVVVEGAKNKASLQEVEERILTTLSQSQGNILEDEAAVDILDTAKSLSEQLAEKQLNAAKTLRTIAQFREEHQGLARDTAAVFSTLVALPVLNSCYHFSLRWFLNLFSASIRDSSRMESVLVKQSGGPGRQERLFAAFVQSLCGHVTQAMFERDRLPFMLLLCLNILVAREEATKHELEYLAKSASPSSNMISKLERPEWIAPATWARVCHLSNLNTFAGLAEKIIQSPENWKPIVSNPETLFSQEIPKLLNETNVSPFRAFLLTAVFHPQKVERAARRLVFAELQLPELPSTGDLALALEQSKSSTPLVCVLGPGADPSALLFPLAEDMEHTRLTSISMAPHQGSEAETVIALAKQRGTWVCLHNCHLAGEWLQTLESLCGNLEDSNPSFRLWITCNAEAQLPTSVVQRAVKVAYETPSGLRLSMRHSLALQSPMFPECRGKEATFCRLAFGIAFLHALLQGRGQFGSLGWGTPYYFDDCDLALASRQIWMLCREHRRVPLDAATTLLWCHYGGRVADPWDSRSLSLLLADCVNSSVLTQPGYCLASTTSHHFRVPHIATLNACLEQIQTFPDDVNPDIYGVHGRAGLERDLARCAELLADTALTLKPHSPLVHQSVCKEVALRDPTLQEQVEHVLSLLPDNVVDERTTSQLESPLEAVLTSELLQQTRVVREARRSLEAVRFMLHGNCSLTPRLEVLAVELASGQVPTSWSVDTPETKLQQFLDLLIARANTLKKWVSCIQPSSYWLSGLVRPDSFMAAVKQEHARTSGVSLCELDLDFEVMSEYQAETPPHEGAYVHGLFIDGAVWGIEVGHLIEQRVDAPASALPLLWLKPCTRPINKRGRYVCPVYRSKTRGQEVTSVLLENGEMSARHWARRGVAIYLHN